MNQQDLGRSTIRTIVRHLVPLLLLAYLVNYIDRINIGFAGAALRQDLALSSTIFGFAAGLFFLSYFLCEVPSNLILERMGARRWMARIMISCGVLSASMVFVRGEWSFYVLRFMLGAAEAGFFPGIIFYIVCWFPAAYRARMMALFTLGIPLSTVIGAPVSGLLLSMDGIWGLPGWQWMFLLEGLPAVLLGIVIYLHLPDRPAEARWLSPEQKQWLETALASDPSRPVRSHLFETFHSFYDPRVLGLALIYFCNLGANYTLAFFLPQIVGAMGLGQMQTQLLVAVPAAMGVLGLLTIGWLSGRHANRSLLIACLSIAGTGLAAAALFGASGASVVGIGALAFAGFGIHSLKSPFWSLAPLTLSSSAAAGGIAWINSIGNLGGFFGPALLGWLKDFFGSYQGGILVLAGAQALAILVTLLLRPRAGVS